MRRILLCATVLAVATVSWLAPGGWASGPKPPTSAYPSCQPVVTSHVTVTKRDNHRNAVAGRIAFANDVSCDHDQIRMSVVSTLVRGATKIAASAASCDFTTNLSCSELKLNASGSVRSRFAGTYDVVTTVTTYGYDYVLPYLQSQSHVLTWSDNCSHDSTWTTVSCAFDQTVLVK